MTSEDEGDIGSYCTCEKQITRAKTAASNNICDECGKQQIYNTEALDKIRKQKNIDKEKPGGLREEEYLKAIDNLPSQFEQLNIDTGKREPIYQEIISEVAAGESTGETEAQEGKTKSKHSSPLKTLKNLVRKARLKLEDRTSSKTEFITTPAVSPIGSIDENTPEFLKEYQHIYDNIEHQNSEIRQETSED